MDVNNESPVGGSSAVQTNANQGEGLLPNTNAAVAQMPSMGETATPSGPVIGASPLGSPDNTNAAGAIHETMVNQKAQAANEPKKPGFFSRLLGKSPVQISYEKPAAPTPDHLTQNANGALETPAMPNVSPDAAAAVNTTPTVEAQTPMSETPTPAMSSLDTAPAIPTTPEMTPPATDTSTPSALDQTGEVAHQAEATGGALPTDGTQAPVEASVSPTAANETSSALPVTETPAETPSSFASTETSNMSATSADPLTPGIETPSPTLPETPPPAEPTIPETPPVPQFNNDALAEKPTEPTTTGTDASKPLALESTPPPPAVEDPNKWTVTPTSENSTTAPTSISETTPVQDPLAVAQQPSAQETSPSMPDPLAVGSEISTPAQPTTESSSVEDPLAVGPLTNSETKIEEPSAPQIPTLSTQQQPASEASTTGFGSVMDEAAKAADEASASSLTGTQAPPVENLPTTPVAEVTAPTVEPAASLSNDVLTQAEQTASVAEQTVGALPTYGMQAPAAENPTMPPTGTESSANESVTGTVTTSPTESQTEEKPVTVGGGTQTY